MRARLITLTLIVVGVLLVASSLGAHQREIAIPNTSRSAIEAAYEAGRVNYDEMIALKATLLYEPWNLPDEYRRSAPDKCGTPLAIEIEAALPVLEPDNAAQIRDMRARPVCDTYYDTANFRIHYDTSGTHTIWGWPDTSYRDEIATALEECWTGEVTTLGFRSPPTDGGDPDGGDGSGLYDVYLQNLTGLYGYCQGSYTVPSTPRTDCTSFVVIENDYAGFGYPDPADPMRVTVAHEFCHSCQYSHNYSEETWYMECTAMWVEDTLYDSINDYRGFIFYFYNYPYNSLDWNDATGLRMYGSCVWNFFLSEWADPGIVTDIWYQCENAGPLFGKMNIVLSSRATTLQEAFKAFAIWSWFTGSRDDGYHFEEGAYWPMVAAERTYSTYPVVAGGPIVAHRPDHMAWNYIHLNNPGGDEDLLDVTYDGPNPATVANYAWVNTKTDGGVTDEHGEILLNGWGNGNSTVGAWDGLSTVCLVAVNASTTTDNMVYSVDADRATPVAGSFYADVAEGTDVVTIRWTLAAPELIETLDIMRATSSDGPYVALNEFPMEPVSPGVFVDDDVRPGDELWYKLVATMWDGTVDMVGSRPAVANIEGTLGVSLAPPMPNPSRDGATFEFTVPVEGARAVITVYDVRGRVVTTITDEVRGRGRHAARWSGKDRDGRDVPAGIYFCSLEVAGAVVTQKAMVLK
jgi:hypothetical protein